MGVRGGEYPVKAPPHHVSLAWQTLIPLIRENTTPSERVVQQFFLGEIVSSNCRLLRCRD